jgi:hypothetical protein
MKTYPKVFALVLSALVGAITLEGNSSHIKNLFSPSVSPTDMTLTATTLQVKVGSAYFTAIIQENETTKAWMAQLPLSLDMEDLNRNEKFAKLPKNLPTKLINPGTIQRGDILLWGNQTVVIFYETFSTSYSYTRLGKIENTAGLKEALGQGSVRVLFSR